MSHKLKVGVALGSGSARGLSHIGILKALEEFNLKPDIICGCSIGAIVGAAYAADNLERFEKWVLGLNRMDLLKFFEVNLSMNGLIDKTKVEQDFNDYVCARRQSIEGLPRKFATVATDIETGREVWFDKGPVMSAVFSSMALPGLFPPYYNEGQWLVDGGLVNPVPAALCRALGAEVIIAVNLNSVSGRQRFAKQIDLDEKTDVVATHPAQNTKKSGSQMALELLGGNRSQLVSNVASSFKSYSNFINSLKQGNPQPPGLIDIFARSINIMQERVTNSRLTNDAPDLILTPPVGDIGLIEFYRAQEAIQAGYQCAQQARTELKALATMVNQQEI